MKIKKHVAISDSGVIYNSATGDSYSINPIAVKILELLKTYTSEEDIKSTLKDTYDVHEERLEGDLYDFFSHL